MNTTDKRDQRITELERDLKRARQRYDDLRADFDHAVKEHDRHVERLKAAHEDSAGRISALVEQIRECNAQIELWIEAFEMVQGADGKWEWGSSLIADRDKWFNEYRKLLADWNAFVPGYNKVVAPTASLRNMGRPLAAGPGQVNKIKALRKRGRSLRWIAEETNLGLQTVRTVLDKVDGVDRATRKRLERIAPDRFAEARTRRSIKEVAALPKRINANLKRNAELMKAAKGLR